MPALQAHPRSVFKPLLRQCELYARSAWPVLLQGETGVGKELLARHIHATSDRRTGPFVPVNCAAMPATLFESELFGHEKGAFSGANHYFRGLFRSAHGGTLFLDEIGDLERSLQVKLLRVLETSEVRAIGSTRMDRLNVRFVAATNVDLGAAIHTGSFRHDLFQRLSVLSLQVPPLRERPEDLIPLAIQICTELGASYAPSSLNELSDYHWPGNVRQLKNVLIRAAVLGGGQLTSELIAERIREERTKSAGPMEVDPLHGTLAEIERRVILQTLRRCHGNRKKTARELGIAKSTLHEKLRRWREESGPSLDWPLVRDTDTVMVAEFAGRPQTRVDV